jgi:hypothetical protein
MHKLGFPKKLVKLCVSLNNEIYVKVKTGKHLSSEFKVNIGLTQGDAIAPLLFNTVWETAFRRSKGESWETNFDKCSLIMAYADDMLITEEDYKILTNLVHSTHTYLPVKMGQRVPKHQHLKLRRRGITQKKLYKITRCSRITSLVKQTNKMGLEIYEKKSKFMIVSCKP